MSAETTYIVYDGECPFCTRYVKLLRLREAMGPVKLVDARSDHPVLQRLRERNIDLDVGMAVVQGDRIAHGADGIHALATMSTPSSLFNRVNAWVFRSPAVSRVLYPPMRAVRNATLRLLGRKKIGEGTV